MKLAEIASRNMTDNETSLGRKVGWFQCDLMDSIDNSAITLLLITLLPLAGHCFLVC